MDEGSVANRLPRALFLFLFLNQDLPYSEVQFSVSAWSDSITTSSLLIQGDFWFGCSHGLIYKEKNILNMNLSPSDTCDSGFLKRTNSVASDDIWDSRWKSDHAEDADTPIYEKEFLLCMNWCIPPVQIHYRNHEPCSGLIIPEWDQKQSIWHLKMLIGWPESRIW